LPVQYRYAHQIMTSSSASSSAPSVALSTASEPRANEIQGEHTDLNARLPTTNLTQDALTTICVADITGNAKHGGDSYNDCAPESRGFSLKFRFLPQ
jgi:hypothetical protein